MKPCLNRHRAAATATIAAALAVATAQAQIPGGTPGTPASAPQESKSVQVEELPQSFWEADLPGGNFLIALGAIRFVSINQYIVDGNVRVHEVDVGSDSSSLARFYFLELVAASGGVTAASTLLERAKGIAESVAERTGAEPVWKQVQKNYPTTTHAHTIEFRLEYRSDLERLYASVKNAWLNGQGARIRIRDE
jgi:hypothetical protein